MARRLGRVAVGLDPSPDRLGWAIVDEVTDAAIATGTEDLCGTGPTGVYRAVERIAARAPGDVVAVGVESPWAGPNKRIALMIAETMGQAAQAAGVIWPEARIVRLAPTEWRKRAGLSGRASKDEVMVRAKAEGFEPKTQDEADAAMMALAVTG